MRVRINLISVKDFLKCPIFNDPRKFFKYLKLIDKALSTWPSDKKIRKYKVFYGIIFRWFIVVNFLHVSLSISVKIYFSQENPVHVAKQLSQLMIIIDALFHAILFKIERPRFQVLFFEIEQYLNTANFREMEIIKKYYKRYTLFYFVLAVTFMITVLITVINCPALSNSLPIEAWYPFPINSLLLFSLIYTVQVIAVLQTAIMLPIDFTIISLFWYAAARFKILGIKLKNVSNDFQFRNWIQSHYSLIWFGKEMERVVRLIILKTIVVVAIIIISGGFQLKNANTKTVLSQFILVIFIASLRLFGWSHPADDLSEMSENIRWSACNLVWNRRSPKVIKSSFIIIQRCHKPLNIVICRIFNLRLSLRFFASYMSTICSYFLTLNAVFQPTKLQ